MLVVLTRMDSRVKSLEKEVVAVKYILDSFTSNIQSIKACLVGALKRLELRDDLKKNSIEMLSSMVKASPMVVQGNENVDPTKG